MMVAFDRHVDRALQLTAQLLPLLVQAAGGVDEFRRFALYLMSFRHFGKRFGTKDLKKETKS